MTIDIEFRNTKTGTGTHGIFEMNLNTYEKLKDLLGYSGIDIEVSGFDYPYKTVKNGEQMCNGAICGGVMSESALRKGMKKYGVYFGMMSFIMPDNQFKRYEKYQHAKNKRMATKVFDRWARSII